VLGPSEGGLGEQAATDGLPASGRNAYLSGANAFFADERRVLPSAQSITVPSRATWCNGARTRLKTACRTSTLVCRWASLARADSPVNLGGTGSNARSSIDILAGLLLVLKRILPMVMDTGQAFLSPEKLVSCVWLDIPIMGTTFDPAGKAFYQGKEWAVSTANPTPSTCHDLSPTSGCMSHHQSTVSISEYNRSTIESYSRIGASTISEL